MLQLLELQDEAKRVETELRGVDLDARRAPDVRPDARFDLGDARAADGSVGSFPRDLGHHSAAAAGRSPIQSARSASARALSAWFLARVFAAPARRAASGSGGNNPKLTFMGGTDRGRASIAPT